MDTSLVKSTSQKLVRGSSAHSVTYPPPKQLFRSSAIDVQSAVVMASTRLASLINAAAEPGKFLAIAENMEGMSREALELAFVYMERNRKTVEGMPTPGEIWELGEKLLGEKRAEERQSEFAREMKHLRARRDAGEEFFGWADVMKLMAPVLGTSEQELTADERRERSNKEINDRRAELQRQKVELCKR